LREQQPGYASEMIPILTPADENGWYHLVTGDESWFFLSYSPSQRQTLTRDDVATKSRHDIHTKKCVFTVIWNPLGFYVIEKFLTGTKMNSDYFITNILAIHEQMIFSNGRKLNIKRPTVHFDDCSIHTGGAIEIYVTEHYMARLKHPPYSSDLARSDFYLLPTIKERLKDIQMIDKEDLFYPLKELSKGIPRRELAKVFGT
jgi:hypothetical protein